MYEVSRTSFTPKQLYGSLNSSLPRYGGTFNRRTGMMDLDAASASRLAATNPGAVADTYDHSKSFADLALMRAIHNHPTAAPPPARWAAAAQQPPAQPKPRPKRRNLAPMMGARQPAPAASGGNRSFLRPLMGY